MQDDDRLSRILQQYHKEDDDFGFFAVSEEEYNQKIDTSAQTAAQSAASKTADEYKKRLVQVEQIIIPFLSKLHSTGEKEYIYWPNRKPVIESQIEKILKLTRD